MTAFLQPLSSPVIPQGSSEPPTGNVRSPAADAGVAPRVDAVLPNQTGDGTDPFAAAEAIAKALSGSNNLEVTSFQDEDTGRFVTRITDRWSGRVLVQSPAVEFLRFLAAGGSLSDTSTLIDA